MPFQLSVPRPDEVKARIDNSAARALVHFGQLVEQAMKDMSAQSVSVPVPDMPHIDKAVQVIKLDLERIGWVTTIDRGSQRDPQHNFIIALP